MEARPAVIDLNFAIDYRRQGWRFTKIGRSQVDYLKKVERFLWLQQKK